MFQYDFMQHGFLAGTVVAIMCGVIGVYVIERRLSFIAHTFSEIGFSGATFAIYMGWNPLYGLLLFAVVSALAIGQLGVKVFRRDLSINVILSIFLGLGLLFLSLSTKQSTAAVSLLFGSVLGISSEQVWQICGLSTGVLVVCLIGFKMLTFDSFDPVGAEAAGLPVRSYLNYIFTLPLYCGSGSCSNCRVAPCFYLNDHSSSYSTSFNSENFSHDSLLSIIPVLGVWIGLILAYYTNGPVSFFIAAIEGIFYFAALGWRNAHERKKSMQIRTKNRKKMPI